MSGDNLPTPTTGFTHPQHERTSPPVYRDFPSQNMEARLSKLERAFDIQRVEIAAEMKAIRKDMDGATKALEKIEALFGRALWIVAAGVLGYFVTFVMQGGLVNAGV